MVFNVSHWKHINEATTLGPKIFMKVFLYPTKAITEYFLVHTSVETSVIISSVTQSSNVITYNSSLG